MENAVFVLVIFGMASTPSYAVFGIGDIVFDPSALSQQLISYMNMIRQYVTQAQQYATQLQQLSAQTQNLQNLNYMIDLTGLQDMQRDNSVRSWHRQRLRNLAAANTTRCTRSFPNSAQCPGKTLPIKALEWNQETANTNRDAMDLISKTKDWFNSDTNDLRKLTVKANNVCRGQGRFTVHRADRGSPVETTDSASANNVSFSKG